MCRLFCTKKHHLNDSNDFAINYSIGISMVNLIIGIIIQKIY